MWIISENLKNRVTTETTTKKKYFNIRTRGPTSAGVQFMF